MDIIDAILTRRSTRKFKSQPVSKEQVTLLLKAAMQAPSACNQQPWRFFIIEDQNVLETFSSIHSGFTFFKHAPMAILICGEPEKATLPFYWRQDCTAATMNLLLAAHASGLGVIWAGIHPDGGEDSELIKKTLALKPEYVPFSLVAVGYADEDGAVSSRYDEGNIIGWK